MAAARTADAPGGWEPLAHPVRVRLTASDLQVVEAFAARLGVSRAWFIRRAIALGAPEVVAEVAAARRAGAAPGGAHQRAAGALGLPAAAGGSPSLVTWQPAARSAPAARSVVPLDD